MFRVRMTARPNRAAPAFFITASQPLPLAVVFGLCHRTHVLRGYPRKGGQLYAGSGCCAEAHLLLALSPKLQPAVAGGTRGIAAAIFNGVKRWFPSNEASMVSATNIAAAATVANSAIQGYRSVGSKKSKYCDCFWTRPQHMVYESLSWSANSRSIHKLLTTQQLHSTTRTPIQNDKICHCFYPYPYLRLADALCRPSSYHS
jgi:hypothetical protein